jgi:hypothetical protein
MTVSMLAEHPHGDAMGRPLTRILAMAEEIGYNFSVGAMRDTIGSETQDITSLLWRTEVSKDKSHR